MHEYVDGDALVREFMRWKSLEMYAQTMCDV